MNRLTWRSECFANQLPLDLRWFGSEIDGSPVPEMFGVLEVIGSRVSGQCVCIWCLGRTGDASEHVGFVEVGVKMC